MIVDAAAAQVIYPCYWSKTANSCYVSSNYVVKYAGLGNTSSNVDRWVY